MEPIGLSKYNHDRGPVQKRNAPAVIPVACNPSAYVDLTGDDDEQVQVNTMQPQPAPRQLDGVLDGVLEGEDFELEGGFREQHRIIHEQQRVNLEHQIDNVPRPETMRPTPVFLSGSAILRDADQELDLSKIQLPSPLHAFVDAHRDAGPIFSQFISKTKWITDFKGFISKSYIFQLTDDHCQQAWSYVVKMCYSLLNTYHLRKSNPTMDAKQVQQEYEKQLLSVAGENSKPSAPENQIEGENPRSQVATPILDLNMDGVKDGNGHDPNDMHPEATNSMDTKEEEDDDSDEEFPDVPYTNQWVRRLPSGEIDFTTLKPRKVIRRNKAGKSIKVQYGSVASFCKGTEMANPYIKLTREDLRRAWFHFLPLYKDKLDLTHVRQQNPRMNDKELAGEVDRQVLEVLHQFDHATIIPFSQILLRKIPALDRRLVKYCERGQHLMAKDKEEKFRKKAKKLGCDISNWEPQYLKLQPDLFANLRMDPPVMRSKTQEKKRQMTSYTQSRGEGLSQQQPLPRFMSARDSGFGIMATTRRQPVSQHQYPNPFSSSLHAPHPQPFGQYEKFEIGYDNPRHQQMAAQAPQLHPAQDPFLANNNPALANPYNAWNSIILEIEQLDREQRLRQQSNYVAVPVPYDSPDAMKRYTPQPSRQSPGFQSAPITRTNRGQEDMEDYESQPSRQNFEIQSSSELRHLRPDPTMAIHAPQPLKMQPTFQSPPSLSQTPAEDMMDADSPLYSLHSLSLKTPDIRNKSITCTTSLGFGSTSHNTNLEDQSFIMGPPSPKANDRDLTQANSKPHWCTCKILRIPADAYYEDVPKTIAKHEERYSLVQQDKIIGDKLVKVADVEGDGHEKIRGSVEEVMQEDVEDGNIDDEVEEQILRELRESTKEEIQKDFDDMLPEGRDYRERFYN